VEKRKLKKVFLAFKLKVKMKNMIAKNLLKILACPKCKGSVEEKGMFLICRKCKLAYPILNGDVPDMLIEDAWNLEKAKRNKFKHEIKL